MNPQNSRLHLKELKNIVNILPVSVNVKFSNKVINPEVPLANLESCLNKSVPAQPAHQKPTPGVGKALPLLLGGEE